MSFRSNERTLQVAWRAATDDLSAAARRPGCYTGKGSGRGRDAMFLHEDHTAENLHTAIRDEALGLFSDEGIPWHDSATRAKDRPSSFLMDSMVSCVNALAPLWRAPEALAEFLRPVVPDAVSAEVVEDDRVLTFEWIGLDNPLDEPWPDRKRGAYGTSLDAFCVLRTGDDRRVAVGIEWKYFERYEGEDKSRSKYFYAPWFEAEDGPLRCDRIGGCGALFREPFYQLARSQCLVHEIARQHQHAATEGVFVLVAPDGNLDYREGVHDSTLRAQFPGRQVPEVFQALLADPTRFAVTSLVRLMNAFDEHRWPDIAGPMASVRARYVDGRRG